MNSHNKAGRLLSVSLLAAALGACATSKTVDQKIAEATSQTNKKIESVEGQVEDLQQKQKQTDVHLAANDVKLSELSQEAQDALKRAQEAGVLAKGKVVFQQTFSEDRVKFKSGSDETAKTP